jgi:hypothetical protein
MLDSSAKVVLAHQHLKETLYKVKLLDICVRRANTVQKEQPKNNLVHRANIIHSKVNLFA